MPLSPWSVPPGLWRDEPCYILGGGPSLADLDLAALRAKVADDRARGIGGRVIAVNNAFALWPDADLLFFGDGEDRWFGWNKRELHRFEGPLIVTRAENVDPATSTARVPIRSLGYARRRGRFFAPEHQALSRLPDRLGGFCGGSNAVNLAFLAGARPIVLFGFDMRIDPARGANWHMQHRLPTEPTQHASKFIPAFAAMAAELAREGVPVLNATPGSAMTCFPVVRPEDVLRDFVSAVRTPRRRCRVGRRSSGGVVADAPAGSTGLC